MGASCASVTATDWHSLGSHWGTPALFTQLGASVEQGSQRRAVGRRRVSGKPGFLFEPSFGTVTVWHNNAVRLGGTSGRNPGEAVEEAPAPGPFSPWSPADERRCMATLSGHQGQAQWLHTREGSPAVWRWKSPRSSVWMVQHNTSETNYFSLLVVTTCKAHPTAARYVRAKRVSLGAQQSLCPVPSNVSVQPHTEPRAETL